MRAIDAEIAAALARIVASVELRVALAKRRQPSAWNRRSVGQRYRADRIVQQPKEK